MATATTGTEPRPGESLVDTGPQAVLALADQGLTQREIASALHMSQATVTRRIREATEQREAQRKALVHNAALIVVMICAIIVAAAAASLAWG